MNRIVPMNFSAHSIQDLLNLFLKFKRSQGKRRVPIKTTRIFFASGHAILSS